MGVEDVEGKEGGRGWGEEKGKGKRRTIETDKLLLSLSQTGPSVTSSFRVEMCICMLPLDLLISEKLRARGMAGERGVQDNKERVQERVSLDSTPRRQLCWNEFSTVRINSVPLVLVPVRGAALKPSAELLRDLSSVL